MHSIHSICFRRTLLPLACLPLSRPTQIPYLCHTPLKSPTAVIPTQAKHALQSDPKKRLEVFAVSEREIKMVTYQNLWNRFRAGEWQ